MYETTSRNHPSYYHDIILHIFREEEKDACEIRSR